MNKSTTANKVLPKAGLNGFDWAFVQGSTAVTLLNFCAKNPRLRQYPKRCGAILRSCATSFRSATPTDLRRPLGLRTSVALTKLLQKNKFFLRNFVKPSGTLCSIFDIRIKNNKIIFE
jgi:hypothetical protein